jgi:hypothetical protein
LLGLHLNEAETLLKNKKIPYKVTAIQGKKDKERLTIPRVIKISENADNIEVIISYFPNYLE